MPVHKVHVDGKPGYRWGDHGKVYHFTEGDKASEEAAKAKARKQGSAAYAAGYEGKEP